MYTQRDRTHRYEWLRPAELAAEMKQRPLIFVPIAPLEYHGPHIPLGTDPLEAQEVALRAAAKVGGVVMPPTFIGTDIVRTRELLLDLGFEGDEHILGMDFPSSIVKSLYYPEEFVAILVRGLLEGLVQQGYRLIVIVNGHGGVNHVALLNRLAAEFTARGMAHVLNFVAWASPGDVPQRGLEGATYGLPVGHADKIETGRMMVLNPDAVDLSTLPPVGEPLHNIEHAVVDYMTWRGQPTPDHSVRESGDPRIGATVEFGEETFEASATHIAGIAAAALRRMGYSPRPQPELVLTTAHEGPVPESRCNHRLLKGGEYGG